LAIIVIHTAYNILLFSDFYDDIFVSSASIQKPPYNPLIRATLTSYKGYTYLQFTVLPLISNYEAEHVLPNNFLAEVANRWNRHAVSPLVMATVPAREVCVLIHSLKLSLLQIPATLNTSLEHVTSLKPHS
jgi:hypothetical protein